MAFVHHISIRVPWHDDQWRGTVCKRPQDNGACVALPEIAEAKRDEVEMCIAGRRFDELEEAELPPCVKERATFMAPFTLRRMLTHPYKETDSAVHRDLQTMRLQQPPFSAACIPFKWMRREFADGLAKGWRLDYDPAREPTEPRWLAEAGWVQDGRNQRAMLDGFFSTIKPELKTPLRIRRSSSPPRGFHKNRRCTLERMLKPKRHPEDACWRRVSTWKPRRGLPSIRNLRRVSSRHDA
jgi:hypothetical protein